MNELNKDDVSDDVKVLNQVANEIHVRGVFKESIDTFFEITEILTYDELKELFDANGWEAFHRLASNNDMIQRIFNETEYHENMFDIFLQALHLICQTEKEHLTDFTTRQDVIDAFEETVEGKENPEAAIIHSWLTDQTDVRGYMVKMFPLCCIKVLMGHFDELVEGWEIKTGDYETKLKCECGIHYKHLINEVQDSRDVFKCCQRCGRCITSMTLVSARITQLVKTKYKRKWLIFKVKDNEVINYGCVSSKHKIVDGNATKYKMKKATKTKPKNKKSLKDSVIVK